MQLSEAVTSKCAAAGVNKTDVNICIELGPHSALARPVKQILQACGAEALKFPYLSALLRKRDAVETGMELAPVLFDQGANSQMGAIDFPQPGKATTLLVQMPRSPWNHNTT